MSLLSVYLNVLSKLRSRDNTDYGPIYRKVVQRVSDLSGSDDKNNFVHNRLLEWTAQKTYLGKQALETFWT
jgi:hypothetical protein